MALRVACAERQAHNRVMTSRIGMVGALTACALALLTGCAPADIQGTWWLVSGHDASGEFSSDLLGPTDGDSSGRIIVTIDGTSVGGHACNSFGGTITTWGDSVTISPGAITEMWCEEPAGLMELESRVFLGLSSIRERYVSGDTVTFTGPSIEMVFERAETD